MVRTSKYDVSILLFLLLCSVAHGVEKLHIVEQDAMTFWLPSTELLGEVPPASIGGDEWAVALVGGLGIYSEYRAELSVFRLPISDTRVEGRRDFRLRITSILRRGEWLWVATQGHGVHIFGLQKRAFLPSKDDPSAGPKSMRFFDDPYSNELWSIEHLKLHRWVDGEWIQLNSKFRKFADSAPSMGRVLFDPEKIWIHYHGSRQGLIVIDRETNEWSAPDESWEIAEGISAGRHLGVVSLLLAEKYVWALSAPGNFYNAWVNEFDRETEVWTSYPIEDSQAPLDRLIGALPSVSWIENRNLVRDLQRLSSQIAEMRAGASYGRTPDENRRIAQLAAILTQAFEAHELINVRDLGQTAHWIEDRAILQMGDNGVPERVATLQFEQHNWHEIIGADPTGRVVAWSETGLYRIDPTALAVDRISAPPELRRGAWEQFVLPAEGNRALFFRKYWRGTHGPAESMLFIVRAGDLEAELIADLPIGRLGRIGNALAVREYNANVLHRFDELEQEWSRVEPELSFERLEELPKRLEFANGAEVILEIDGLLYRRPILAERVGERVNEAVGAGR